MLSKQIDGVIRALATGKYKQSESLLENIKTRVVQLEEELADLNTKRVVRWETHENILRENHRLRDIARFIVDDNNHISGHPVVVAVLIHADFLYLQSLTGVKNVSP